MRFKDYLFENTIKSFDKHLINEDYMRFLKKNPHLTPDQRETINKFYTGKGSQHAVKEFEREIGWQSKRVKEMTWEDFVKVMKSSKAGQRELLQSTKIPGSKGKDYWPIKLRNKDYIANIPLNFKTAKYMNSCKYGTINVNFCIGNDDFGDKYWKKYVLLSRKVPIYITDGKGKWVVMIKHGNRNYEVWNKLNDMDLTGINKEPIPNFSIKKELLSDGLKKLYDELREKRFKYIHWVDKAKIKNARYEMDENNPAFIIWKSGTWVWGIWEDGTWKDGTWKYGIWGYGTWEKGTWENGTWENGTWESGTWEGGIWEYGTWKKGTWKKGTWKNGFWEKGTWESGTWEKGTWEDGIWLGGYDKNGDYHPKGDSPDKWNDTHWIKKAKIKDAIYEIDKYEQNYIVWKNGTWEWGTWEDGTWEYGTWEDGTWEWGTWEDGTWEYGTWEGGTWEGGTWEYGIWEGGTWEDGTWEDGIWERGTWEGGIWKRGTWLGGYDKDGNYHPEGDSPDKWNK